MKPVTARSFRFPFSMALVALVTLGACRNTREGAEKDAEILARQSKEQAAVLEAEAKRGAEKAAEVTAEVASDVKEGASEVASEMKEGAEKAAEVTSEALDEAGMRAAAAGRTMEVKSALMADKRVDASRIDVDSEYAVKIVHLRGAVSTEAERTIAESIAAEKSPGWKISNELIVQAK